MSALYVCCMLLVLCTVTEAWKTTFKKVQIAAGVLPVLVSLGGAPGSGAVELGTHTGCSYPACTNQEEILKSNAPGLISTAEKEGYIRDLKDMQFILGNGFNLMLEQKDYESMRAGVRQVSLEITL